MNLPSHLRERIIQAPSGCWIWVGHLKNGYGAAPSGKRGVAVLAHRAVWEALMGPIPAGLEIDHLCRVRRCVNPRHLQPVTHAVNVRRGNGGWHQRRKTHCPAGHAYTPDNIKKGNGRRQCLACHNERERERKRQARQAAA